jgi:hypothetical protein
MTCAEVTKTNPELDDYRWLVSDAASPWLARAAGPSEPLARQAARLRKDLSAGRTHLVLEQADLRRRGRDKFAAAERMFFTRKGLEQATDQWVAAYKAGRFTQAQAVADLCTGIGGDLLALARRGPACGVERDPVAAFLAESNLRAVGVAGELRVADAAEFPLADVAAWHVDPDRRPAGRRTTRVELHEPELATLDRWLQVRESAAIKLSPAAEAPGAWQRRAELEWISRAGQCRQLVAWFGALAHAPGRRRATIVGNSPEGPAVLASWLGDASVGPPIAAQVDRYLFDPDPAILASGLLGPVAVAEHLAALAPWGGYLTGPEPLQRPGLAALEVDEVLPFDVKRLRRLLADRGVGRLEIKKRAVDCDPDSLRKKLQLRGDRDAVLVVAPLGQSIVAILSHRRPLGSERT